MVTCLLVAGSAFKCLSSLTGLYFRSGSGIRADESSASASTSQSSSSKTVESTSTGAERSLVLMMFGVYLLAAMIALVVDESYLETGLDSAYESFNRSAAVFLADNAALDSRCIGITPEICVLNPVP